MILEVPDDVLQLAALAGSRIPLHSSASFPRTRVAPDPDADRPGGAAVRSSRRPMVLAGGGVHLSGAPPR